MISRAELYVLPWPIERACFHDAGRDIDLSVFEPAQHVCRRGMARRGPPGAREYHKTALRWPAFDANSQWTWPEVTPSRIAFGERSFLMARLSSRVVASLRNGRINGNGLSRCRSAV